MKHKKRLGSELAAQEIGLVEQLRQHPEMKARIETILEIAYDSAGPLQTADQIEQRLIEAVRRLGQETMRQWATQAEGRVSHELKQQDPTVLSRKKKR